MIVSEKMQGMTPTRFTRKNNGLLLSLLILTMLSGMGRLAFANPVAIDSVRMRLSPDRTRIVFDLSAPVEHRILHSPILSVWS